MTLTPITMPCAPDAYYVGLMSGTSLDGVDGVLVHFTPDQPLQVVAHTYLPMPADLREELLALNTAGSNELHRAALAANQLICTLYAPAVKQLLTQARIQPQQVAAIGAHGQTVRHQPHFQSNMPGGMQSDAPRQQVGYSIQLNAPALLAELTGIAVACDFRSRDIAAGGHGAPLVPAFHAEVFGQALQTVGVLNLGGVANLSVLHADQSITGFDCGPANALMDGWCEEHTGQPFDASGAWAATGNLIPALLASMLSEPYFSQPAPKSTGRDLFNMAWLAQHVGSASYTALRPQDVQATLLELTAYTCAQALQRYAPQAAELIVCGGGALNTQLMQRLQSLVNPAPMLSSADKGLPPLQVEATAFAWLARQCLNHQCANLPSVTGAKGLRVLGAVYPA